MQKLKDLIIKMNDFGIPLPLLRVDGKASLTATMVFLSFNAALLGQSGKLAGFFGGVDLSSANYLFLIALSAYLGRKMQSDGKTVTITNPDGKE